MTIGSRFRTIRRAFGRITQIVTSCGCSHAAVDAREIEPNGPTTLRLRSNLAGRYGPLAFECRVVINETIEQTFRVQTFGHKVFDVQPAPLIFDKLAPSERAQQPLSIATVARHGEVPKVSLAQLTDSDSIRVSEPKVEIKTLSDDLVEHRHTFEVSVNPHRYDQEGQGSLQATASVNGETYTTNVGVSWRVRSPYVITPSRLFLRQRPQLADDRAVEITISRHDGRSVTVKSVVLFC